MLPSLNSRPTAAFYTETMASQTLRPVLQDKGNQILDKPWKLSNVTAPKLKNTCQKDPKDTSSDAAKLSASFPPPHPSSSQSVQRDKCAARKSLGVSIDAARSQMPLAADSVPQHKRPHSADSLQPACKMASRSANEAEKLPITNTDGKLLSHSHALSTDNAKVQSDQNGQLLDAADEALMEGDKSYTASAKVAPSYVPPVSKRSRSTRLAAASSRRRSAAVAVSPLEDVPTKRPRTRTSGRALPKESSQALGKSGDNVQGVVFPSDLKPIQYCNDRKLENGQDVWECMKDLASIADAVLPQDDNKTKKLNKRKSSDDDTHLLERLQVSWGGKNYMEVLQSSAPMDSPEETMHSTPEAEEPAAKPAVTPSVYKFVSLKTDNIISDGEATKHARQGGKKATAKGSQQQIRKASQPTGKLANNATRKATARKLRSSAKIQHPAKLHQASQPDPAVAALSKGAQAPIGGLGTSVEAVAATKEVRSATLGTNVTSQPTSLTLDTAHIDAIQAAATKVEVSSKIGAQGTSYPTSVAAATKVEVSSTIGVQDASHPASLTVNHAQVAPAAAAASKPPSKKSRAEVKPDVINPVGACTRSNPSNPPSLTADKVPPVGHRSLFGSPRTVSTPAKQVTKSKGSGVPITRDTTGPSKAGTDTRLRELQDTVKEQQQSFQAVQQEMAAMRKEIAALKTELIKKEHENNRLRNACNKKDERMKKYQAETKAEIERHAHTKQQLAVQRDSKQPKPYQK